MCECGDLLTAHRTHAKSGKSPPSIAVVATADTAAATTAAAEVATTAVAAIVLLIATVAASTAQLEVFNEAQAQRLERKITALVKSGTDETSLRSVVRDATKLGRRP